MIRCSKCFRSSCIECKTASHSGMTCSENKVHHLPQDPQTLKWKRKNGVKACPHCGSETTRVSGCPDMICSTCHLHWDWNQTGEPPSKESRIEKIGFYYPRLMKEVVGSRDTIEDWQKDKREVAIRIVPWAIAMSVVGVPLVCLTGPPAFVAKRIRMRRSQRS